MDLCTNAGIVSDALKFVERKKEQLDTLQMIDERIEEIEEEKRRALKGYFDRAYSSEFVPDCLLWILPIRTKICSMKSAMTTVANTQTSPKKNVIFAM
jgi:hypothetical protein